MKSRAFMLIVIGPLFFSACGGGGSTQPAHTPSYTIGGTASGLLGTGLVLQDNGGNNLTVAANGTFTFSTLITEGGAFNVTVLTQPSSPSQNCVVTGGTGTASANVTGVQVACVGLWTWIAGPTEPDQAGVYGTLGVPAAGNTPGARESAVHWTDSSGNVWLFGGAGDDSTDTNAELNDLWKYSAGEWAWIGGSNLGHQPGTHGTLGIAAPGNIPGARSQAVSWTDAAGNFWLFGGIGYYSAADGQGYLNDLWKYSAGEWTWMGGPNIADQHGVYGTQGTAAPGNVPGARGEAVAWTDASGNFWLFGGFGADSSGAEDYLNDLWKYSSGQWTWMGGSNLRDQFGTYGTLGTAAPNNVPGSRSQAVSWTDASGNFWFFGGEGYGASGSEDVLNDLWKYSTGQWTWMSGSSMTDQEGTYGILGIASPNNVPGAREGGVGWTDTSGNLWLFGSSGLNDLWEYSAGEWAWMGGPNVVNQPGTYGTQGTAAPDNIPGARRNGIVWTDASGNVWLFGGYGYGAGGSASSINDLWEYQP
jgi:N-acetylneuraminic acid mutarotase